jgi:transcriptional regulator with XRE-family HTH domain
MNELNFDIGYTRMYSQDMTIGDRLDKAMKARDVESQSELARKSTVPQPTINRILKGGGKKGPETETIKKLASALSVSFTWLNEGIGNMEGGALPPVASPQTQAANDQDVTGDEIIELINAYRAASPTDRAILMTSARTAAKRALDKQRRRTSNN